MLPPNELEARNFRKVMKGYSTADVDEYVEFIIEKYKELYRAYNLLERKYTGASAELETYKENEESIRRTLEDSQTTGEKLLRQAEERSALILRTAKEECDTVLDNFRAKVKEESDKLHELREQVATFKRSIFEQYNQHIEYLEKISPDNEEYEDVGVSDVLSETVENIVNRANSQIDLFDNTDFIADEPYVAIDSLTNEDTSDDVAEGGEIADSADDVAEDAIDAIEDTVTEDEKEVLDISFDSEPEESSSTIEFPIISETSEEQAKIDAAADLIFGSND